MIDYVVTPLRRYATIAMLAMLTQAAEAQVGHDPARTPYSDVRHGVWIVLSGGQFFGNGGDVGVAPHDGPTFGVKMSFMANKTVQLNGGFYYGMLGRMIYDPTQPQGDRFTGPVDNDVIWLDGSINFNLMGGKTWHRLAPYIGSGLGMAIVEDVQGTNFNLGTKFVFSPLIGVRFFVTDAVALSLENRFNFWNIKYTASFAQESVSSSEWSVTPWVNIGLAIAWPF
jgi:opacity protein-like surface antigen